MLLVSFILFLIIMQLPLEQRMQVYLPSGKPRKTAEEMQKVIDRTIEKYGLDEPFLVQYGNWLRELSRGNLGYSPTWRQPVLEGLRQRAPATIELALFAMIPAISLALALGSLAVRFENRLPDHALQGAAFVGWALPPFILALALIRIFYANFGWFPPERLSAWANQIVHSDAFHSYTGMHTLDALLNGRLNIFGDALRHLALPCLSLAAVQWALLVRVMRSSLLESLSQDYIVTARSKGLAESQVINRHARRNALLPVISTVGTAALMLINSVVVIEVIFHINGVGRWAAESMMQADIPVSIGFVLFSCLVTVLASLAADVLYAVVDPRIRLE